MQTANPHRNRLTSRRQDSSHLVTDQGRAADCGACSPCLESGPRNRLGRGRAQEPKRTQRSGQAVHQRILDESMPQAGCILGRPRRNYCTERGHQSVRFNCSTRTRSRSSPAELRAGFSSALRVAQVRNTVACVQDLGRTGALHLYQIIQNRLPSRNGGCARRSGRAGEYVTMMNPKVRDSDRHAHRTDRIASYACLRYMQRLANLGPTVSWSSRFILRMKNFRMVIFVAQLRRLLARRCACRARLPSYAT